MRPHLAVKLHLNVVSRHRKLWVWLTTFVAGLMLLKIFAPLFGPLDATFSWVAVAILLPYGCVGMWEERRARKADQSA